jgi:hypothetical protein
MFKSFVNIQELEVMSSQQLVPAYANEYIPTESFWPTPPQHQPQCTCQCGANRMDNSGQSISSTGSMWDPTQYPPRQQWNRESMSGYPSPVSSPPSEPFILSAKDSVLQEDDDEKKTFYAKPALDDYAQHMLKLDQVRSGFTDYNNNAYNGLVATEAVFSDMAKYRRSTSPVLALASPALTEHDVSQDAPNCEFLMYNNGENPLFGSSPPPPPTLQTHVSTPPNRHSSKPLLKSQPNTYKCDFPNCTATFTRPYNLKSHKRTHTNERPYACPHDGCNKTFARHHDRNRHAKLHMGLKPYSCPHCSKCFARQDALIRHSKIENAPCSQVLQTKKLPLKFKFLNGR